MTTINFATSNKGSSIYAGNLPIMQRPALKSTQEKSERQQKAAGQIEFWEKQKENLKNRECSTIEDIAKKLEMFHSYENEIAAVKMQYNQEQMWHAMDEAREIGEKIAEATEKHEPKTAEERKKEMVEEALGTDEEKGVLTEIMDELLQEEVSQPEEISQSEKISQPEEELLDVVLHLQMDSVHIDYRVVIPNPIDGST